MNTPTSLRIARILLFIAAGFAAAPPLVILQMSQEPLGALPYLALFVLTALGFVIAGRELGTRPGRAKLLAVAAATSMAAVGTIAGWSLGMITFPGAAIGVLGAWAALLHPPRRGVVVAFVLYLAVGVFSAVARGTDFAFMWAIPTLFIWPVWLLVTPSFSILAIYGAIAVAAVLAVRAFVRPRVFDAARPARWVPLAAGLGLLAGIAAVMAFVGWAYARPETSARFELEPLVLALVFAGGLLLAAGIVTLRLSPSWLTAVGIGLGATLLFLTFTYRPAVSCSASGSAQGLPLSWALTSFGSQSMGSSGSSGTIGPIGPGSGASTQSGEFRSGDRSATFRCEGAEVVDYREVR